MVTVKNSLVWCLCLAILSIPVLFWFTFNSSSKFDAACLASHGVAVHTIYKNICIKPDTIISIPPEKIIDIPDELFPPEK